MMVRYFDGAEPLPREPGDDPVPEFEPVTVAGEPFLCPVVRWEEDWGFERGEDEDYRLGRAEQDYEAYLDRVMHHGT